jgi:uncharacterized protein YjbI with pentapeptide repeats
MKSFVLKSLTKRSRPYYPSSLNYDFADFSNADLSYADLSNCSLRFANLTGANLESAVMDNTSLEMAVFDSQTRLPFSLGEAFMKGMILQIHSPNGDDLFYKANAHCT